MNEQHDQPSVPSKNAFVENVTRIGTATQRVEAFLLSASILVIAALTILNVFCRSVLGFSLAVTEEISQFCIIVVCFVGLSYAAGTGRHIRMTAIYDQLNPRMRKAFMVIITAVTSAIMLTLGCYAVGYVMAVYELGGVFPVLQVPFFIVYAIAPIGLFLAGIQYGLATVRNLISPEIYLSFETKDEYEQPVTKET